MKRMKSLNIAVTMQIDIMTSLNVSIGPYKLYTWHPMHYESPTFTFNNKNEVNMQVLDTLTLKHKNMTTLKDEENVSGITCKYLH